MTNDFFPESMSEIFAQITVEKLGRQLAETNAEKLQLVDVREGYEIQLGRCRDCSFSPEPVCRMVW